MASRFSRLGAITACAVAIRWAYALALYAAFGNDGLMSADSYSYLQHGQILARQIAGGAIPPWAWLGTDLQIMPMFTWFMTASVMAAGSYAPITAALLQGLIDAGTCLLVYGIATAIAPRFAFAAGLAAALNPTQIVVAGLIYNDTLFVFFAALALFGGIRFMQTPGWGWTLLTGLAIAAAAATRVLIVLWVPVLVLVLLLALVLTSTFTRRQLAQLICMAVIGAIGVAPVLWRNVDKYDAWALTPQGGGHLALWVLPLVKEAQDGTPWAEGSKVMEAEMRQRFPVPDPNPFVESKHYAEFGRAKLMSYGSIAIAKAWLIGAALNLGAPAGIMSPAVSKLPRTGFYDTQGASIWQKAWKFLFHSDNALYAWIALAGIIGLAAFRLVQLIGAARLLRQPAALGPLFLLGLWFGFILVINGPIASPKYRLPLEPVFALLTGAGVRALLRRAES